MFDTNLRLISMLGLLTLVVVFGLLFDYLRLLKRPLRLGLWTAILGITIGFILTLVAVLPGNKFYGQVFSEVSTNQKVVALTFDDGPYPPYTDMVLDVLKEAGVPATFFVIGQNVEKHPETTARIVEEGHQIGNHTYHHIDLLKADKKTIEQEVDKTSQAVRAAAGVIPTVARPPHGFRDPVVMEVLQERGFKVVEWSIMSRDWTNPGVNVIVERTLKKVKNGSVILLHDGDGLAQASPRAETVEALRQIIRQLSAQGYTFVTVDQILSKNGE